MATYRGKYPTNIRTVSCGKDRPVHLYTNAGNHYVLTVDQCRKVDAVRLPEPGTEIEPYLQAQRETIETIRPDVRPQNWEALAQSLSDILLIPGNDRAPSIVGAFRRGRPQEWVGLACAQLYQCAERTFNGNQRAQALAIIDTMRNYGLIA